MTSALLLTDESGRQGATFRRRSATEHLAAMTQSDSRVSVKCHSLNSSTERGCEFGQRLMAFILFCYFGVFFVAKKERDELHAAAKSF